MRKRYDICFILALFVIGFMATFSYGVYLDQGSEQEIVYSNIKEYLLHIPLDTELCKDFTNAGIVKISDSIEKDHGVAVYYPAFVVWYINQDNPYYGSVFWHLYTYIFVFFTGCCSLYLLIKDLFQSRKTASFVTMLFFFTPRMFAESHYNNKDMVLLALLFSSFYWGWLLIKRCAWIDVLLFAICGAFLFNIKMIGVWFFAIIGLFALLHFIFTGKINKVIWIKVCVCILVWLCTYVLITPASWSGFGDFMQYLFSYAVNFQRWISYILYKGELLHTEYTGIPHKYLPTMILLTVPVGILSLIVCGAIILVRDMFKNRFRNIFAQEGYVCMIAFAGFIPLAYAILAKTPVYNGWRHFYFVYASMIICAGYGVYRLQEIFYTKRVGKLLYGCGVIYVAMMLISLWINHPQEHSYYNWLAGNELENYYELDYWDLSVWQAYESIDANLSNQDIVSVSALNVPTQWGLEGNWKALPQEMREQIVLESAWENADYIIINTTYANMYSLETYEQIKREYEMIDEITSYGNTICEVYKRY